MVQERASISGIKVIATSIHSKRSEGPLPFYAMAATTPLPALLIRMLLALLLCASVTASATTYAKHAKHNTPPPPRSHSKGKAPVKQHHAPPPRRIGPTSPSPPASLLPPLLPRSNSSDNLFDAGDPPLTPYPFGA